MKKCSYCGRENPDNASNCSGCGLDEWESAPNVSVEPEEELDDLVLLTTCPKLSDADLIVSRLEAAGISSIIPDEHLMQNIGFNLNTYGYVRVQVRRQDFAAAKALLPKQEPAPQVEPAVGSGEKKVIASMHVSQMTEIMERLKAAGIHYELRTATDDNGLDLSELLVDSRDFDRGCDIVEAWAEELEAARRKQSKVCCPRCGSHDYKAVPHATLESVWQCEKCGQEFPRN